MKLIGRWYVRKERRGLACLVIDNRHEVEKSKHLEQQTSQSVSNTIDNEPLTFADIFPLAARCTKRQAWPIIREEVRLRVYSALLRALISYLEADPNTPNGGNFLSTSAYRKDQYYPDISRDSSAESIYRITSLPSTRASRSGTTLLKEQVISLVTLVVTPHEKADEIFNSAQNMSMSTLLKAKAEETADTLMRG